MGQPKQERAVQTRLALMRAAAEVFDECGYTGAGINKILKRAGLTAGALYFHFGSKEGLAKAVMNAQQDTIEPLLDSRGLQRLVDITLVWSHQLAADPLLRAGVELSLGHEKFVDEAPFEGWRELMTGYLREARDLGELREGVDPEVVARFVVGACTGVQLYARQVDGRAGLPRRVTEMWDCLLPGIAAPGTAHTFDTGVARGKRLSRRTGTTGTGAGE
ncbi:ScbR family autoregulator-binding transcription factor [Streptomyces lavendofoliae]|uniref:Gamma-butyrolactone-binding protein n=1 Tax=Streptomyces lavendofoliae TaxID=67314 RepID=A0A918HWE3_9ACTN|nr:ScbR family autoregulator-binding transcription factor [Streptomyces lavendofoliae]GGU32837.1 gamma-butyrolactone-binding protein [Streptomyces lavendofoliae]